MGLSLSGCGQTGAPDRFVGFGQNPTLPEPLKGLIPQVAIARVTPWRAGEHPKAPEGFTVTRFAEGLDHPRWVYVLPNGDVLVAESSSESKPPKTFRDQAAAWIMKSAGANTKSPNKVILLRDADGNGIAELKTVFAEGIKRPFGMALVGQTLYIAADNAIVSYSYHDGMTHVDGPGEKVFDLPGDPINHHWTKNIIASQDGTKLYATVGSNSNVGENGMAAEDGRAQITEFALPKGPSRALATGIRNPNGLDFEPVTGALWTAVNERDEIGPDLVPDYMTRVRDGAFYGWPYSYYGQHVDVRIQPQRPDLVAKAITPDFALGPHTASLGLAFYKAKAFPAHYRGGVFIGQHGSWNRKPLNGYRVVFIPFENGKPINHPEVFLSGFLTDKSEARGRPVGVAVDKTGSLLVADDVGAVIWRVAVKQPEAKASS
ncbi:MAG: sorbosone dehydrogenase [Phenylobacterium zucineum]|nr:MAG: sorbosone dehydrogenase [Phenylobacterium zucineum]